MSDLIYQDWGLIDYQKALDQQLELVQKVHDENLPGYLIFCSHPAVITTGRQTQEGDIFAWQGPIVEVSRGGRATYHGPSQVVVYPILNLSHARKGRGPQEIRGYLRTLEDGIVKVLNHYDIPAVGRSPQQKPTDANAVDETGVWVGSQKVASLGIAVKKWVSFHGAAINLDHDASAFQGMNPCGFTSKTMVSVEELCHRKIDREEFKNRLREELEEKL